MSSFLNQGDTSNQEQNANNTNPQEGVEQQSQPFLKVGDRVFSTPEDAAKNIEHAQTHIDKLERDWEAATKLIERQEQLLERSSRVDDILNAVKDKEQASGDAESTAQLSEEDVINKAISAFEQRQTQQAMAQQQEENWNQVTSALTQTYGEKTDEVVQKVAADNGMSLEDAATMARTYPKVFLKMFDTSGNPNPKPNRSSVNTEAFANQPAQAPRKSIMKMSSKEAADYVQRKLAELED